MQPDGLQGLKYLLSGLLEKKFADFCYRPVDPGPFGRQVKPARVPSVFITIALCYVLVSGSHIFQEDTFYKIISQLIEFE